MYFSSGQGGFIIRLTYLLLTFFFHLAIFLVALVGLANFWLPMVDDYKGILEKELSDFVGNRISIGSIRVDRDSEDPRWIMENLQLTEASGQSPIHIQKLALTLDLRESLRTLRLQPADVQLEGVEFVLRQDSEGLPIVEGLQFPLPGQKNSALNIERKSPIRVDINGGFVHWMDTVNNRTLALGDLQFTGEFLSQEIILQADALFPREIGESLAVDAVLHQAKTDDGETVWDGNLHTRTQIFNLAALPSPLLKKYGVTTGALKLDANIKSVTGKPLQVNGEGEISYLGWQGTETIPAMNGVNASFVADNDGGKVKVKVKDSTLNYPHWFEQPLRVDALDADLQWAVQETGWHWQMTGLQARNPDASAQGSATLDVPVGKPAEINLNMHFATQRTVDNVRNYIPAMLPDSTEKWLKTAIVHGYVPRGEFILRGNPADFPFRNKAGEFDIRFDIENGVLAYLPEWPEARAVTGELRFHNASMSAKVKSAKIMDLDVVGGTVDIPDMHKNARLLLDLDTQGDLQAHMNYLQDAPIGRNLRDFMQVAKFSGPSDLRLKLDVPLTKSILDKEGVQVDGLVSLHDNRFSIPEYNQTFTKLNGAVYFDQHGVDTNGASGEYRQQPVKLSASTDKTKGVITVGLQQHNDPALFLPENLSSLKNYLHGKTAIETRLELPAFNFKASKSPASLKIHSFSDLQGVEISLPAPLAKPAETARKVQVDVELPFDSLKPWQVGVDMGKHLKVAATLPHKGKQASAIGISLGGKVAKPPAQGISIGGELETFDLLALQGMGTSVSQAGGKGADELPPISANLSIDDLKLGQQSLGKASLTAEGQAILQAHVRSGKAQANLHLPVKDISSGRVNVDLNHIDLNQLSDSMPNQGKGKGNGLSPADFPAMRLTCRDCRKGDFPIQNLTLSMNKVRKDLQIEKLEISNPLLAFSSTQGRWYTAADGSSRTELHAIAHIPDPGKLLLGQGSEAGLQGGELHATAQLAWQGAPFSFALDSLSGEGQATLGKGNLTEVEPGIGRLLGLLDIQRLPTRLSMDFRDMTGKGVAFDSISGSFHLEHGVLTTEDTIIDAPAMTAGIRGSTDLVSKTHNQSVTVIPNLSSALPLVGAAVGGLGGGAVMLLFNSVTEKSLEEKLNSSGGFRYQVTGSWAKPDVSEIKTPAKQTDVDVLPH